MAKAGEFFEAYSAGTDPTDLHPMAIQVSKEIGIDISRHKVTSVEKYFRESFDWVVTVCNRAKEKCPIYPLAMWLHWDIEEPTDLGSFRRVRDELLQRVNAFLNGTYIQDGTWLGGKTISKTRSDE